MNAKLAGATFLGVLGACILLNLGCEGSGSLIDAPQLDAAQPDGSQPDGSRGDSGRDSGATGGHDGGRFDGASADSGEDASRDGGSSDAGSDAAVDGGSTDEEPYNFVVILTDDQRFDTLWAMPIVSERVAAEGVKFTNGYVSTPLCCPYRASLLAGGFYAKNTGVLTLVSPNGGFMGFVDSDTLATALQDKGYATAMIGKYLNQYEPPYKPPGWTKFFSDPATFQDTARLEEEALDFLDTHGDSPFFLYLATGAPHYPAIPMPEDAALFPDYVYRDRAYGEEDLSDKPAWVSRMASNTSMHFGTVEAEDEFHRDQIRTLVGVDRAVGAIMDRLEALGKLDRTVIIFTSDNGYMWGEHGLWTKRFAYEESLRVPMVVRMPGVTPRVDENLVVSNLDIGPTICELAGISRAGDGQSLLPLLRNASAPWRSEFLIEDYGNDFGRAGFLWAGVVRRSPSGFWKYVEHPGGSVELYDLEADPFEFTSRHSDPALAELRADMGTALNGMRGLAATNLQRARTASVGLAFELALTAWGGDGVYSWSIVNGALPPGLSLDPGTGRIEGVPTLAGTFPVQVQVQDTALATFAGRPQRFIQRLNFSIE